MSYKLRLDKFEGPLDLLLHLIKQNEVDVSDIPIATIADQYIEYLDMMKELDLEIASEFLVMAATLMEIKSRMLLPTQPDEEDLEEDPRFELIEQILEYKKYKELSTHLGDLHERESHFFQRDFREDVDMEVQEPLIEVSLFELLQAFQRVLEYASVDPFREVTLDEVSVEEMMQDLRAMLHERKNVLLEEIFKNRPHSKIVLITTFLALLELIRLNEAVARQTRLFDEIRIFSIEKEE